MGQWLALYTLQEISLCSPRGCRFPGLLTLTPSELVWLAFHQLKFAAVESMRVVDFLLFNRLLIWSAIIRRGSLGRMHYSVLVPIGAWFLAI